MGKATRLQAKKKKEIAKACAREAAAPPTTILDVPDDLLELVLLRVSSPVCLFRAAATCKPWRRVVAGAGFLQRFRALHGPHLLLGHYSMVTEDGVRRLNAEFLPSPPRPAELLRQHLSLDFLPRPAAFSDNSHQLVLTDSRRGLLAGVRDNWYAVVCDTWAGQYRELDFPWVHHGERYFGDCPYHCLGAFLLDGDGGGGGGGGASPMSGFRLLCAWLFRDDRDYTVSAHACVYSARGCRWLRSSATTNVGHEHYWNEQGAYYKRFLGRAGGSILWSGRHGRVLALDESTGEFSTFRLPAAVAAVDRINTVYPLYESRRDYLRVVGGGVVGGVRIVAVVGGDLEVLAWAHGAGECTVERRVGVCQLANIEDSPGMAWFLMDGTTVSAELVIIAFISASSTFGDFTLDVETMKLRPMQSTACAGQTVFPYELPWPQTISTCL